MSFDVHYPDCEVGIVPQEVTGAAVVWKNGQFDKGGSAGTSKGLVARYDRLS